MTPERRDYIIRNLESHSREEVIDELLSGGEKQAQQQVDEVIAEQQPATTPGPTVIDNGEPATSEAVAVLPLESVAQETAPTTNVHDLFQRRYWEEVDVRRLHLYTKSDLDAIRAEIWAEVTQGKPHICADCATEKYEDENGKVVIDNLPPIIEEPMPEFPVMSGALWNLAMELFPDIPMSFKFMSLVTHWGLVRSGLDVLAGQRNFQTRFYVCLVSDPWCGKTAAMNEAHNYLISIYPRYTFLYADGVDSGPALCDDFEDLRKANPEATRLMILLHADEMTDLFEKSKSTAQSRNTLGTMQLSLYESNSVANRARQANKGKRIQIENAHLAILGGTTLDGYKMMWQKTGGGANGLQSRFIPIGTNAGAMPVQPRESTAAMMGCLKQISILAQKSGQTVYLEPEAEKVLSDWWMKYQRSQNPCAIRVLDMVKRMILILAVTNIDPSMEDMMDDNHVGVGVDLVRQACHFGDYIIKMRELLNPIDSYTFTQAFENSVMKVFGKFDRPLSQRDVRRMLNVDRQPGGLQSFLAAWQTLERAGMIVQIGTTGKGKGLFVKEAA
jgi:hypothetical protein